jgi:RNA polymerase sigma-70 factor, ECF subfamily
MSLAVDPDLRKEAMHALRPQTPDPFVDLYETHFDFVWRSLRRLGVPVAHVDDAAQEVFVVAFRRFETFQGRSSAKTWLFGIAVHTMQHFQRSAKHAVQELPEALPDTNGTNPHDAAVRSEAIQTLYRVLDSLDSTHRVVFVMAELEQMTAPSIAEVLHVPINTVYSRLRHGRHQFDAELRRLQARESWRQR